MIFFPYNFSLTKKVSVLVILALGLLLMELPIAAASDTNILNVE